MPPVKRKSLGGSLQPEVSQSEQSTFDISLSQEPSAGIHENDDAAERRARRKSRLHNHITDPLQASPQRQNSNKGHQETVLTHAQLAEHYSDCIKLSSENKISKRNAFGLKLIDYMADILKKNGTNFQMASASLDASAKIYTCRVDNVWDTTNQMLVNLVSTNKKGRVGVDDMAPGGGVEAGSAMDEDTLGQRDGDDPDDTHPETKKRKKKIRKGKTIETNLNSIRVTHFESNFEKDPLFQILSEAFDSGTGGLLLNHLHAVDDSNMLLLDSNALRDRESEQKLMTDSRKRKCPCGGDDIVDPSLINDKFICPSLRTFKFGGTGDEEGDESVLSQILSQKDKDSDKHAFDMDAEPEPIDDALPLDEGGGMDDDDDGGGLDGEPPMYGDEPMDFKLGNNNTEIQLGASALTKDVTDLTNLSLLSHSLVNSIDQLNEFSYFKQDKLRLWVGPEHWKPTSLGFRRRDTQMMTDLQKKRKEKEKFVFKYHEEECTKIDEGKQAPPDNVGMWEKHLKKSRAATEMAQLTLKKWREEEKKNELESFLTEKDLRGFHLNMRKDLFLHRARINRDATVADVDAGVGEYNYDNANDCNFVPAINTSGNRVGDYEDDDAGGDDVGADDFASAVDAYTDLEGPIGNLEEYGPSQAGFAGAFTQENLIAAPSQVAALDIAYAKQAKKIDIKRLKGILWRILTQTDANQTGDGTRAATSEAVGRHSFHQTITEAKTMLPQTMADNLSVPLAFVSMLYVVNEKSLAIEGQSDLQDFHLSQGHPPS